ncbi:MAG: SPOR domain-containing protein, partial [Thermodesulfovibrionia bacterium]|nr:SPOR domain-containing protein [Thermodesulfovibrionia bacterium]
PVLYENFAGGSRKPVADFIRSSTQYDIDKKQSAAVVKEVQTRDIKVKEPLELVHLQTVSYKEKVEEMVTTGNLSGKGKVYDLKQSLYKKIAAVNNKYYVQVGSWKNSQYAEDILIKLKKDYPEANIVEQNNFNKVRIPGAMTKKQAAIISKDIEGKLNMKPLIVRGIYNVSLDDAVRPFIGTSYTKIDCYGLIVRGLMNQGVQYHGHGGLREKLENLAERDGLPNNAYLNGEGLVEKAGMKIFSKFTSRISNVPEKTDEIYSEITRYLREGLILSFSTSTRGHTGIVSRRENDWTYINSGIIDNQISPGEVSERVGEEFLKAEIKNWFVLAAGRKEPLTVTLGRLDVNQLHDFDGLKEKNKLAALNIY